MKRYDYLIIGCGLYGSVIAEQLTLIPQHYYKIFFLST